MMDWPLSDRTRLLGSSCFLATFVETADVLKASAQTVSLYALDILIK